MKKNITAVVYILVCLACSEESVNTDPIDNNTSNLSIRFTSIPITAIDHNREYNYNLRTGLTEGDTTIFFNLKIPNWLSYNLENNSISGLADWENVNEVFNVSLQATNKIDTIQQSFSIEVKLGEIICDSSFGDPEQSEYILPFKTGESYLVNQSYCPSNPAWGHHNWFAYDFEMDIGQEIIASRGGEVIAIQSHNPDVADCSGGKENWVFVLHDDGTVMQYVHLQQDGIKVSKGQMVSQGELLGISGNSGCSSGPHTHIALFRNRTNYDRQSTIPFNYKNANGPLDGNNGLVHNEIYTAL